MNCATAKAWIRADSIGIAIAKGETILWCLEINRKRPWGITPHGAALAHLSEIAAFLETQAWGERGPNFLAQALSGWIHRVRHGGVRCRIQDSFQRFNSQPSLFEGGGDCELAKEFVFELPSSNRWKDMSNQHLTRLDEILRSQRLPNDDDNQPPLLIFCNPTIRWVDSALDSIRRDAFLTMTKGECCAAVNAVIGAKEKPPTVYARIVEKRMSIRTVGPREKADRDAAGPAWRTAN